MPTLPLCWAAWEGVVAVKCKVPATITDLTTDLTADVLHSPIGPGTVVKARSSAAAELA